MSFDKTTHEIHERRLGRNIGVGLVLAAFVALMMGLTIVKVSNMDNPVPGLSRSGGD